MPDRVVGPSQGRRSGPRFFCASPKSPNPSPCTFARRSACAQNIDHPVISVFQDMIYVFRYSSPEGCRPAGDPAEAAAWMWPEDRSHRMIGHARRRERARPPRLGRTAIAEQTAWRPSLRRECSEFSVRYKRSLLLSPSSPYLTRIMGADQAAPSAERPDGFSESAL
jgi:hypothetical protein